MIPTISQVCSLNSSFAADIEDYSAGHCRSIELWLTKLETYIESHSIAEVRGLLDRCEVSAEVASYQGGLLTSQGDARREAWNLFERRLAMCRELGVRTLVVACDVVSPITAQDVERLRLSLLLIAQRAEQNQMRIALEFQARSAIGNNLQTTISLVDEVASPALGICFDVFQFYLGPSKMSDLGGLTKQNLFHVQLADLLDVPREFASDSDRIVPGDGDFVIEPIIDHLRDIDYANCVSMELMNPRIWRIPVRQFGEIATTALRKLLGQASPL